MFGNNAEYFTVKQTIAFPEYTNSSFYHDIGLIELNRAVNFTPYMRPACLPPLNYNVANVKEFIASTWESVGEKFLKIKLSSVTQR